MKKITIYSLIISSIFIFSMIYNHSQNNIPVEYKNVELEHVEISAEEAVEIAKKDFTSNKKNGIGTHL